MPCPYIREDGFKTEREDTLLTEPIRELTDDRVEGSEGFLVLVGAAWI
jgi:hypothetical protein